MVSEIYYGKLSEYAKTNWENMNDPFKVLEEKKIIPMGGWTFLFMDKKYFTNEIQCDWGSFAWKCSKKDLIRFQDESNCPLADIDTIEDDDECGVVFIEMW